MKKIIPYVLIVSLLVCALASPVSAAEINTVNFLNYLASFSDVRDDLSYIELEGGTGEVVFRLSKDLDFPIYSIDLIISCDKGTLDEFEFGAFNTSCNLIFTRGTTNFYRVFSTLYDPMYLLERQDIQLFLYGSSGAVASILKFNVSPLPFTQIDINGSAAIYQDNELIGNSDLRSSIQKLVLIEAPVNPDPEETIIYDDLPYRFVYSLTEAKNFDAFDFRATYRNFYINSVTVFAGGQVLPVDYQLLQANDGTYNYYELAFDADLTGIDRTSSYNIEIHVNGVFYAENPGLFDLHGVVNYCRGFLYSDVEDWKVNYFDRFLQSLEEIFDVSISIDQVINGVFKEWLQEHKWIGADLSDGLTTIDQSIQYYSEELYSFLEFFQSDVNASFLRLYGVLEEQFENLETVLYEIFDIPSQEAEQFEQGVINQDQELQAIVQGTKIDTPNADSVTGDVSNIVDFSQVALITSPIGAFFENPLIYGIFLLSFTLMLASYVLYGKR